MAFQTPKTDWSVADGVRDTDFNRIEGNILELYIQDAARDSSTIYVSPSGTDASGKGTSALPYATIGKALSTLPKNLNGKSITVNIASGVYNEAVVVSGFSNGTVVFTGSGIPNVKSLDVTDGSVLVVNDVAIAASNSSFGIRATNGATLLASGGFILTGCSIGVEVTGCSRIHIGGTLTVNSCTTGVVASNNSSIFVAQVSGTGAGTGLSASNGGVISYGNFALTVLNAISITSSGGRINTSSQPGTGGGGIL